MKLIVYEFEENEPGTEELMTNLLNRYGKPMWTDGDVTIVNALAKVKVLKVCRNCRKERVAPTRRLYCSKKCMRAVNRRKFYIRHGR